MNNEKQISNRVKWSIQWSTANLISFRSSKEHRSSISFLNNNNTTLRCTGDFGLESLFNFTRFNRLPIRADTYQLRVYTLNKTS